MHTSATALRLAISSFFFAGVTACTAGAPAPGGAAAEEREPGPSASTPARIESTPVLPRVEDSSPARWTIFVYANGDSGRSRDLATDLERMSQAKLAADMRVVVLADWNAALTREDGTPFPSGSEWLALSGDGERTRIALDSEQDLDDPAVLRAAIARAFWEYPAEHHGLVIWSRSNAGDVQDGRRPGVKPIALPEMQSAIRGGLDDASLHGERPLDFIGFDTYASARVDVAYALRELAQVHIQSTAGPSGSTWAHAEALSFLATHPDATGQSFAAFEASAAEKYGRRAHAAIATTSLDAVATATSSLVRAVVENPDVLPRVVDAIAAATPGPNAPPSYRRLISELTKTPSSPVATAAEEVATRLAQTIVGPMDASDLTIALPTPGSSSAPNAADLEPTNEWRAATGWDDLTASVIGCDPSSPPSTSTTLP